MALSAPVLDAAPPAGPSGSPGRPSDSLAIEPPGDAAEDTLRQGPPEDVYPFPVITVTAIRQGIAQILQPIRLDFDRWQTAEEVTWATGRLAGSFLKSYGGPGSLQSLSIGGGGSAHTMVLMEGIPLNSPQSGGLDLSILPMGLVGRIEYLPHGGSTLYGSAALSGVVNLAPRTPRTGAMLTTGSFGHSRVQGSLGWPGESAGLALGQVSYGGDFPYTVRGREALRGNNRFHQNYLQARGEWSRGRRSQSLSLWLTQSERGIPGPAWDPNPSASRDDIWALVSATSSWSSSRGSHRWLLYGQGQQQHYRDPDHAIYGDHRFMIGSSTYEYGRSWTSRVSSLSRLEGRLESLTSTGAGDRNRTQWDLVQQLVYQVTPSAAILPVVRISWIAGHSVWVTGDAAVQWQPQHLSVLEQVTLVGGRNLRQPDFNDLYWIPGGNPHLRPEWSTMGGVKTRWRLGPSLRLDAQGYHTRYRDLIKWTPGEGGLWQPRNIDVARSTTLTVTMAWSWPHDRIVLEAGWDGVFTENLTPGFTQGKPLRFTSPHAGRLQLVTRITGGWTVALMGSGRSSYVTYYDFPQDTINPARWTWDGYLRWVPQNDGGQHGTVRSLADWRGYTGAVTLSSTNLGAKTYETIPGYPEPGRTVSLSLQLERK